uniref:Immunoglobulin V-set domain-containing protein n=1 Tax=Oncorhynchus mykiss TaxID=8022 RepID=A0A8C7VKT9_ONCMY
VLTIFGTRGNVTIDCHMTSENINYMVWYKLTTGMVLQYITKYSKYQKDIGNYFTYSMFSEYLKTVIQQPVSESVQHGSGESFPGIIYTHGDRSDQCEKSSEAGSPTQRCVYKLPKRNLSLSDAGTYYCAVASCWEILFGNWTKLDVEGNFFHFVFNRKRVEIWECNFRLKLRKGSDPYDVVNYAAVSFTTKKSPSSRRERAQTSREDAEYSEVRYLQQE